MKVANRPEVDRFPGFPVALAATVLLALLPILLARIPPLGDYPNHLARFNILAHYGEQGWMREFWNVRWKPLPNLGVDLIATGLARIFPILTAGRLALGIIVLVHGFGFLALSRAWIGRATVWGLLGFPLLYTYPWLKGFLNYELGLGIMMAALAVHLHLRRRGLGRYAAAMTPLSLALMLAHLEAFGILIAMLAALEYGLGRHGEQTPLSLREAALRSAVLIPLPALYFLAGPTGGVGLGVVWSSLGAKIAALGTVFYGGELGPTLLVVALLLLAVAASIRAGVRVARTGGIVVLALAGLLLILPYGLLTTRYIDTRVAPVMLIAAFAFLDPGRPGRKRLRWAHLAVGAFIAAHLLLVAASYGRRGAELDRVDSALSRLPPGGLVFTVFSDTNKDLRESEWEPPLMHAAAIGALTNRLYPVGLFVFPGQQPLEVRPEFRGVVQNKHFNDRRAPGQWVRRIQAFRATLPAAWQGRPVYVLFRHGHDPAPTTPGARAIAGDRTWTLYLLDGLRPSPTSSRISP